MAEMLVTAYLTVAAIAAVVVLIVSSRVGEERRLTASRVALSAAAGLVWPVLLLGMAEVGSFVMYAKVHEAEAEDDIPGPLVGASFGR